jgi:hypothetical protein
MLKVLGAQYRLILLLVSAGTSLVGLGPANAQLSKQEKERISTTMAAEINSTITKYPKEGILFRERVVSRLVQCGDLFVFMSTHADNPETRRRISDVAEISFEVSTRVSDGIAVDRLRQITNTAKQEMKDKFAAERTQESEREMGALLKNCKSFHKVDEVSGAVAALLSSDSRQ